MKKIILFSSVGVLTAFSVFNMAIIKEIPVWQIAVTLGLVSAMFAMLWNDSGTQ